MARRKTAKDAADMLLGGAENGSDEEAGSEVEEGKTGDYEVEKIIADRWKDHRQEYLVKWFGFNKKSDNTWEPVENLHACPEILEAYLAEKKTKKVGKPPAKAAATATSPSKAATSTTRRGAGQENPGAKSVQPSRPTRGSYLDASDDDDEDEKFSAPDDRSTYSRNGTSAATNGTRSGRGNGATRSQVQKKPAAKPSVNALDESDDDDLPLAFSRSSETDSRQASVNLRSSKGRVSAGAASAGDGYESDEMGAPTKRSKPTGNDSKARKGPSGIRESNDMIFNGLPGDGDESDEMEVPPKRQKPTGNDTKARKASPKASTSKRQATLDDSDDEQEKERETSVNARGTGYRQAKVKAASAIRVTTPQKKDTPPKKAKKDVSPDEDAEDEGEYVVERILGSLIGEGKLWYLVKWDGYDEMKDNTWEPAKNLSHAKKVIGEFTAQYGKPSHKQLKILTEEGEEYEKEFPPQEAEE